MKLHSLIKGVVISYAFPNPPDQIKASILKYLTDGWSSYIPIILKELKTLNTGVLITNKTYSEKGIHVRFSYGTCPDGFYMRIDTYALRFHFIFGKGELSQVSQDTKMADGIFDTMLGLLSTSSDITTETVIYQPHLPDTLYDSLGIKHPAPTEEMTQRVFYVEDVPTGFIKGDDTYILVPFDAFHEMISKLAENPYYDPNVNTGLELIKNFKKGLKEGQFD